MRSVFGVLLDGATLWPWREPKGVGSDVNRKKRISRLVRKWEIRCGEHSPADGQVRRNLRTRPSAAAAVPVSNQVAGSGMGSGSP